MDEQKEEKIIPISISNSNGITWGLKSIINRWVSARTHNSIANALELRLSSTNPSKWSPDILKILEA